MRKLLFHSYIRNVARNGQDIDVLRNNFNSVCIGQFQASVLSMLA